ncbi:nuclear transport factor 2 family protein [Pontiella agarivorans]|uniref:Nuclear transport factor 2 family protein n=1 Tax=Pontiella agarivorans TaxID=3038953 RepID=A0ABU5MZ68_9BACT|nr:nuclear transport factor 2 family protein [Pontiella agarivorans]MDZ8119498.1 hypothetical protein [Pontiella agarivorans]
MKLTQPEKELKAAVEHLIHSGCNYNLNEFGNIYTPDLKVVIIDPSSQVAILNYEQNYEFFKAKRDSGASPLEETVNFVHLDISGDYGYVVVIRHVAMDIERQKVVFSLNLRKCDGVWKVFRETAMISDEL